MKHLEQLMLTVSLVDKVTKPIQGINQQLKHTGEMGRQSWDKVAGGAAGLAASGVALYQALMPAIEMDRVLGEVKSLGVVQDDLDLLAHTAADFSIEFGKSATEFVGAAYDIKSAMGELSGKELSGITKASAVLAAATKADTATITSYMGTMYGVFKQQAEAMGKDNFAAMVAGQTAQAVEMFKTTGAEMSAAFTSIGAAGTAAGIAMHEQMAVLGTLQATMSGSEAGTKYKAFLAGIAGAQDKLNLSFVDGNGNMLGMVAILQKLKDKFGDTFTVAESDALKKAFGSDEAVALIKQMIPDIDGLAHSIDGVGRQTGMDKATQMAHAMTDQWERLGAVWFALRAGAGASVLPTINAVVGGIVDGMAVLVKWTQMFPHLTEAVTWTALGLAGLTAVAASWTLIMGIGGSIMTFYAGALSGLLGLMRLLRVSFILSGTMTLAWAAITATGTAAVWLFNAALTATRIALAFITGPFGLIAMALVAVGAGAVWLARNWDNLKASIMESDAFMALMGFLDTAQMKWQSFMDMLGNLSPFDLLGSAIDWLIEKINLIPGINIDLNQPAMALPGRAELPPVTQEVVRRQVGETELATPALLAATPLRQAQAPLPLPVPEQQTIEMLPLTPSVPEQRTIETLPLAPPLPEQRTVVALPVAPLLPEQRAIEALPVATPLPEQRAIEPLPVVPPLPEQRTIDSLPVAPTIPAGHARLQQPLAEARAPDTLKAPPAPILPQLARVASQNNGKTVHFGDVHIKNEQGMDPHTLAEWEELQYGF